MEAAEILNLGEYSLRNVTNVDEGNGRELFDYGFRLLLAFQHEVAAKCFSECLVEATHCALAHAFIAYCHGPNYNFKGEAYYQYSYDKSYEGVKDQTSEKGDPPFPSQIIANRHSLLAIQIAEKLKNNTKKAEGSEGLNESSEPYQPTAIQDLEIRIIEAIRILTCDPGVDPCQAEARKDKPFSNAMRKIYEQYPDNPEVSFLFASSLMTLHAWKLFEYPSGRPLSNDVEEVQFVLEKALEQFPEHAGLCHLYCHLCEMSSHPERALAACNILRKKFPDAGHLLHMPTHIDVLLGDYEACVNWNMAAIQADKKSMTLHPSFNKATSFYFGYIVHDFHMLVYGATLGAMEGIAMKVAEELNTYVNEDLFREAPGLSEYLESYAALDIHVLVRFGRWIEILGIEFPKDINLMLYRSASLYYARAIAFANLGDIQAAKEEAKCYEKIKVNPAAERRILHNNLVSDLLEVDSAMIMGEIAYFEGKHMSAFKELERSVELQDQLNYDEPWGKMQPVRHALGGLLLKYGNVNDAEVVFRQDLKLHPKNPWALTGLIGCLNVQINETSNSSIACGCSGLSGGGNGGSVAPISQEARCAKIAERDALQEQLTKQRMCQW
eukprot:CAMPEP_0194206270 /NCGR_PEP_ID=MMETSP0156-20130528/5341_1 /TAXON_ID=33649 /ORGANISM="Thalassionema nitzschioides, Strain L26-B" /LENGTH=610 /DNA_ID=CAMNT_0038932749 /DNA_START=67 /DNA_END=1896 /DNA_ORIENTATION=+